MACHILTTFFVTISDYQLITDHVAVDLWKEFIFHIFSQWSRIEEHVWLRLRLIFWYLKLGDLVRGELAGVWCTRAQNWIGDVRGRINLKTHFVFIRIVIDRTASDFWNLDFVSLWNFCSYSKACVNVPNTEGFNVSVDLNQVTLGASIRNIGLKAFLLEIIFFSFKANHVRILIHIFWT